MIDQNTFTLSLLFASYSRLNGVKSLTHREFLQTMKFLSQNHIEPKALLSDKAILDTLCPVASISKERMEGLLDSRIEHEHLLKECEKLNINLLSIVDEAFPERILRHLFSSTPPLLFTYGNLELLKEEQTLGVIGYSASNLQFTRDLALYCKNNDICAITINNKAFISALTEFEGKAIIIVPDNLYDLSMDLTLAPSIKAGRLLLLSTNPPKFARANIQVNARLVYALSKRALIIHSDLSKGAAFLSAHEELKRENSIPVFVNNAEDEKGNLLLLEQGAKSWNIKLDRAPKPPKTRFVQQELF